MRTQITIAVQIDGRTRGTVSLPEEAAQNEADVMAAVRRWANDLPLLPDPIAGSGAPRDDGAPSVVALRIALADAQTAFSGEDDRHAALGWLVEHLSALIADSARLKELRRWANDASLGMTIEQVTRIRDAASSSMHHDATLAREQLIGLCDTVEILCVRATPHGSEQQSGERSE